MPAFNGERFVDQALRSACEQTYEDLEVIVWDDGSTDRTAEIVQNVSDPRVRLVRSRANRGHAAALNGALRLARGEYVKFLDADDALGPDCVARLAELMDAHPSMQLALVGLRLELEEADERVLPALARSEEYRAELRELGAVIPGRVVFERHLDKDLLANLVGGPTAVMVRRSRLARSGLCNVRMRFVDLELWLRTMADGDVGCVDADLATYRVHPEALTGRILADERLWIENLWLLEGLATIPELWRSYPRLAELRATRRREYAEGLRGLIRARTVRRRELAEAAAYLGHVGRSAIGRPPRIVEPLPR